MLRLLALILCLAACGEVPTRPDELLFEDGADTIDAGTIDAGEELDTQDAGEADAGPAPVVCGDQVCGDQQECMWGSRGYVCAPCSPEWDNGCAWCGNSGQPCCNTGMGRHACRGDARCYTNHEGNPFCF